MSHVLNEKERHNQVGLEISNSAKMYDSAVLIGLDDAGFHAHSKLNRGVLNSWN